MPTLIDICLGIAIASLAVFMQWQALYLVAIIAMAVFLLITVAVLGHIIRRIICAFIERHR